MGFQEEERCEGKFVINCHCEHETNYYRPEEDHLTKE